MENKNYDIFISYRRFDKEGNPTGRDKARIIAEELIKNGYNVFFDYNEIKDNEFDKDIIPAIEKSKNFILVLTKNALDRCKEKDDWVRKEIELAIKLQRKIINVDPDTSFNGKWPDSLPESISTIKTIHISDLNLGGLIKESIGQLIKDRIKTAEDSESGNQVCSTNTKQNTYHRYWLHLLCIIPLILLILFGIYHYFIYDRDPVVIFAGGGSVKNYLRDELKIDVKEWKNSVYVNLPSGNALNLLEEEAAKYQKNNKENFTFICLSATKLENSDIDNKAVINGITIVGVKLGEDELIAYFDKEILNSKNELEGLEINSLKKYLTSDSVTVFRTSDNSGTLKEYHRCLDDSSTIHLLDTITTFPFLEYQGEAYYNSLKKGLKKHNIVLGSKFYKPDSLLENKKDYNEVRIRIKTSYPQKSLYLYFLAFHNHDDNHIRINNPIINFLEELNKKDKKLIDSKTLDKIVKDKWYDAYKKIEYISPKDNE